MKVKYKVGDKVIISKPMHPSKIGTSYVCGYTTSAVPIGTHGTIIETDVTSLGQRLFIEFKNHSGDVLRDWFLDGEIIPDLLSKSLMDILKETVKEGTKVAAATEATSVAVQGVEEVVGEFYPELLKHPLGRVLANLSVPSVVLLLAEHFPDQVPGDKDKLLEFCELALKGASQKTVEEVKPLFLPVMEKFLSLAAATSDDKLLHEGEKKKPAELPESTTDDDVEVKVEVIDDKKDDKKKKKKDEDKDSEDKDSEDKDSEDKENSDTDDDA